MNRENVDGETASWVRPGETTTTLGIASGKIRESEFFGKQCNHNAPEKTRSVQFSRTQLHPQGSTRVLYWEKKGHHRTEGARKSQNRFMRARQREARIRLQGEGDRRMKFVLSITSGKKPKKKKGVILQAVGGVS